MIVERLKLHAHVGRSGSRISDGSCHLCAVVQVSSAFPIIGGGVFHVRGHPIENWQFVDWQLP